jgi:transcription elongation factor GreA
MTPDGLKRLREELKQIREVERPQNVADIEEARAHGDLSENAEYHAAKERQAMLEARMKELETKISLAEVIDPAAMKGDRVVFGATVVLEDGESGDEVTYTLVGEDEADAKNGRISITSPLARALIGKEVGDEVRFKAPGGMREYELVDLRFGAAPLAEDAR